jgi:hypothetical protein
LVLMGEMGKGLEIVRSLRGRYRGRDRNPFDEYEGGHRYGRVLAGYGMSQGLAGAHYDAVSGTLTLAPRIVGDFRSFLATPTGCGTVGVRNGEPFVDVSAGEIPYREIAYTPYE